MYKNHNEYKNMIWHITGVDNRLLNIDNSIIITSKIKK